MLSFTTRKRMRSFFGRTHSDLPVPNLIKVQKGSYEKFLQYHTKSSTRVKAGLEEVFSSHFPIRDHTGERAAIEYVSYHFDPPKYDVQESMQRGVNYAAPLRVTLRLIIWDEDSGEDDKPKEIKSIKEQDVFLGEVPLMTGRGTFVINGAERVIVSQVHRSPGAFYSHDRGKTHSSGKYLYNARVIPYRGSWLDFEFDTKDILFFRIDRRRKMHVTTLLKAFGLTKDDILKEFYDFISIKRNGKKGWKSKFIPEKFKGLKVRDDIVNCSTGEVIIPAGRKVTPRLMQKLKEVKDVDYKVDIESLSGSYIATDLIDESGEVILESGDEITPEAIERVVHSSIKEIKVLDINYINVGPYILNTLALDKNDTKEEALLDIFRVIRPGEPVTPEIAESVLSQAFTNPSRYDLSAIGRMKINQRHDLDISEEHTILTIEDILVIIKTLVKLKDGIGEIDDIDNLGNRRVRSVGELVENQFRLGLVRMERSIIERMNAVELDAAMPHDLVNSKALMSVIKEFFGTSQLSQFMDQTNPLAEVTHKRRLSALGPGGLQRERAGVEVRDVHTTHYGRMCPIETPEGQNIGLINSLATYAQVNRYGFIESPYYKVVNGVVKNDKVFYLSAIEEEKYVIAQATVQLDKKGKILDELVSCRKSGDIALLAPDKVDYIDVSSKQLVSVAASLIPFLENDDANRAVMGSNMQRQAVPLINREAPLVGTGMEQTVALDSGTVVKADNPGIVHQVDANRIVVRHADGEDDTVGVDIYNLAKLQKSNHGTAIDQKPIVKVGDIVDVGDVIADGSSTDLGELALGQNIMVAFMPWRGYNFEDSIVISERLIKNDDFSSIHVKEFECVARDTRLGPEEITRDMPVTDDSLHSLDEVGIVHVGSKVSAGDILVGKVTPKSEAPLTPEEKLLRAIFGEKAADVKDSSLRVPPSHSGTVVGVQIFTRRGVEKDERAIALERQEIARLSRDRDDKIKIVCDYALESLKKLLLGKSVTSGHGSIRHGMTLTSDLFLDSNLEDIMRLQVKDTTLNKTISKVKELFASKVKEIDAYFNAKVEKVQCGDDMPQGVLKVVKVFVASKLKLQPGDKMAGRHGNKGVVSKIIPVEDMPYLEDGTPVDIVLNSLGIISRMNIGQVLETHLGLVSSTIGREIEQIANRVTSKELGIEDLRVKMLSVYSADNDTPYRDEIKKMSQKELMDLASNLKSGVPYATPVFDGARDAHISEMLHNKKHHTSGQVTLIDGKTGEPFDRKVTVGKIYMMKLDHLVDEKIHARSIGPYGLVTQQPLGGKSHQGGQRFGEMECWALQGYGAAYTLQEMLTVKSDDVMGRIRMYEGIVRGDTSFHVSIPESFNVMAKELNALGLNIELRSNADRNKNKAE